MMSPPQNSSMEAKLHQQKMCSGQKLKSFSSLSDIKSPTVNYSFKKSGRGSLDYNIQDYNDLPDQVSSIRYEPVRSKLVSEDETDRIIKPILCSGSDTQKQLLLLDRKILVHQFIKRSMQSTIRTKKGFLNPLQQKILSEKYLEPEDDVLISSGTSGEYIFNYFWEIIISIVIILLLIWLPLQIGFQVFTDQQLIKILVQLIIVIDSLICVLRRTPKENKEYDIVQKQGHLHNKEVKYSNYCSSVVFMDFVYLLSCSIIQFSSIFSFFIVIALIIQLFYGIKKLETKFDLLSDYFSFDYYLSLFICKIILLIHYCACIWHYIGIIEADSWINYLDIGQLDNYSRYYYSVYWSTATLLNLGQGNISIRTNTELIYSSVTMFISCWIFAQIIMYTFTFGKSKLDNVQYIRQMNIFYIIDNNQRQSIIFLMPEGFQGQFRVKLENTSNIVRIKRKIFIQQSIYQQLKEKESITSKLPANLKEELLFQMRTEALKNCEILQKFSSATLRKLVKQMEYVYFYPNQIIDHQSSLYIIDTGEIEVKQLGKTIKSLQAGDYFGQYSFFSDNVITSQFKIIKFTQLYCISKQVFLKIIQQHPVDYEMYMFIKHSVQQGNYQIINMNCASCNKETHLIQDCPDINYKPNTSKLIQDANGEFQKRRGIKRSSQIDQRLNNQVFKRLTLNTSLAMVFTVQQDTVTFDNESSEELTSNTNKYLVSNQIFLKNSNSLEKKDEQKAVQKKKKSIDSKVRIPINPQTMMKGIIPSFKYDKQQSESALQLEQQSRFPYPLEQTAKSSSEPQLDEYSLKLIPSEELIPQIQRPNLSLLQKSRFNMVSDLNIADNNLPLIQEEDSINLTSEIIPEDQLSIPYGKKFQFNSRSTPPVSSIFLRESEKKISNIEKNQQNETATNLKSNLSPLMINNSRLPTKQQLMDISEFNNKNIIDEFEIMHLYSVYFPFGNYTLAIQRYNCSLKQKLHQLFLSKQKQEFIQEELINYS